MQLCGQCSCGNAALQDGLKVMCSFVGWIKVRPICRLRSGFSAALLRKVRKLKQLCSRIKEKY